MKTPGNRVLYVLLCLLTCVGPGCGQPESAAQFEDVASALPNADEQPSDSTDSQVETSAQFSTNDDVPNIEDVGQQPGDEMSSDEMPSDEVPSALPSSAQPSFQPSIKQQAGLNKSSTGGEIKPVNRDADGYAEVKVFYGTDREPVVTRLDSVGKTASTFTTTIISAALTLLLFVAARSFKSLRFLFGSGAALGVVASVFFAYGTLHVLNRQRVFAERDSIYYGTTRGQLEYGVAKVSIPATHERGKLEAPSILRLEFKEDPTKHVVLLNVSHRPEDEFFEELGDQLGELTEPSTFIFVHGFSVSFEDATRRTAQIAYDMEFTGAPIAYSWPSQGSILGYTADEESIKYTSEHLKEFILKIRSNNPTTSINLVAHSMGNRALTIVLKEIALAQGQAVTSSKLFNEVILAAPDVDADVFKQRVTSQPSIMNVANRVTLYASSNDKALQMSKKVHGFRRAGESGEGLVVIPGLDTIDVSQIDLSILGHNYYGDSQAIIRDLKHAMLLRQDAGQRQWLRAVGFGNNLKYWLYPKINALTGEIP